MNNEDIILPVQYIEKLQQENNRLKEQYCERTDCGGRLGNSKKVERLIQENNELHNKIDKAIDFINSQSPDAGVSGKRIKEILKDSDVDV